MDFQSIDNLAGLEATPQPPVVQQLPTTTTSGCACDAIAPTTNEQAHYLANYIDNNRQTTRSEETGTNNLQLPEHVSTTGGIVNNGTTNSDANGGETRVAIRRKTMENKNQIVKSPEFIARIKVASSGLNLAMLHDLLIRCSSRNVVYDNQQQQTDKKKCRNCNTDEQKKKCIEHKVAEILYRAEKVSAENANQFLAMLSSSSSTKEWHVHILLPRKSNPGAKEQRNTSQKHTPFLFHSVCWQPVAFLCVLKRGIPVLPRMLACVANCNSDTTIPAMTFCINPYHFEPQPSARLPEQQQQPILFNDNQCQQQATTDTNISEDPEKKALREQNEELRKQLAQFQQQQPMIAPVAQHAREHDNDCWQIGNEQRRPIASSSCNYPDGNYNNNNHYLQQLAAAAMQASCSSSNMAYPAADSPMANSSWLPPQLANLPSSSNCTINDDNNSSSTAVSSVMEVDDEEDHQSATTSTTTPPSAALSSAVVAVTDSMASIQLQNRKRAATVMMPVKEKKMKPRTAEEKEKQKQRILEGLKRKKAHKEKKASPDFQARLESALSGFSADKLVEAHDRLIECNRLSNPGEMQKYGEGSHTTPESKAKCIEERMAEVLCKAEQYSPENANKLAAMLADISWHGHIYWPWKYNAGADEARNKRQKQKLNFHHQQWSPENLLKNIKQEIKVRPKAMDQQCTDANNDAGFCINPYHYEPKTAGAMFEQQPQAQETQRPFDQPKQRATTSTTTPFGLVPPSSTALTNASANYCPNTAVAGHQMTTWLQSLGLVSQPQPTLGSLLSTFTAPTSFLQQAPAIAPYAQAVGTGLANVAGAGANCFQPNTAAAGHPPTMMPQTPGQMLSSPSLSLGNLFSTVAAPTLFLQQAPAISPYAQACSQLFAQLPPGTMNSLLSAATATVQQSQQQLPHQLNQPQQLPSNLLNTFPTTAGPLSNNTYLSQLLANILLNNQQPPGGGGGGNTQ